MTDKDNPEANESASNRENQKREGDGVSRSLSGALQQSSTNAERNQTTALKKPHVIVRLWHGLWRKRIFFHQGPNSPNWAEKTSIFITLGILFATSIQAYIYWRQAGIMQQSISQNERNITLAQGELIDANRSSKTAEDTLITSNRPWLDMFVSAASPFVFDDTGGHLSFLVETPNVGHSPAIRVTLTQEFIQVFAINPDPRQELAKLCQQAAKESAGASSPGTTQTVFIGHPEREIWQMTLSPEELAKKVPGSNYKSPYIYPVFIACAAYRADFSENEYWTGYAFNVYKASKKPGGVDSLIDPKNGNIPAEQLQIFQFPFIGAYAK